MKKGQSINNNNSNSNGNHNNNNNNNNNNNFSSAIWEIGASSPRSRANLARRYGSVEVQCKT